MSQWMSQLMSSECHNECQWMSQLISMNVTMNRECHNEYQWMSQWISINVTMNINECHECHSGQDVIKDINCTRKITFVCRFRNIVQYHDKHLTDVHMHWAFLLLFYHCWSMQLIPTLANWIISELTLLSNSTG